MVSNYLHPLKKVYRILDRLVYHAKSMYNSRQHCANYQENLRVMPALRPDLVSKVEILVGSYLPFTRKKTSPHKDLCNYAQSRPNENFSLLHNNVAQQTLRSVEEAYKSNFVLLTRYAVGELEHHPGSPKYLPNDGRYKLAYTRARLAIRNGAVMLGISHMFKKQHGLTGKELKFPIPLCVKPHQTREVTILPVNNGKAYRIEFCYSIPSRSKDLDPNQYLAIDLGLNNVATIVESATGTAVILDGKYLKSINQWYNKENARLQSIKDKQGIQGITTRQARLVMKRDCRIHEAVNRYVIRIVRYAVERKIGTVILPRWEGSRTRSGTASGAIRTSSRSPSTNSGRS